MLISIPFNTPKGTLNIVTGMIQSFQYYNKEFADLYIGVNYGLSFEVHNKLAGTDELLKDIAEAVQPVGCMAVNEQLLTEERVH